VSGGRVTGYELFMSSAIRSLPVLATPSVMKLFDVVSIMLYQLLMYRYYKFRHNNRRTVITLATEHTVQTCSTSSSD